MTTTTTVDVAAIIAKVKASQAALGDVRDAKSDNELADFWATYNTHAQVISALMNAPHQRAREQRELDDLDARRAETVARFAELETTIASFTDWRLVPDVRERDKEYDRQWQTRRALQRLAEGTLLKAPGVAYDRIEYLDERIAAVTAERDRWQHELDYALAQAEQLLGAVAR